MYKNKRNELKGRALEILQQLAREHEGIIADLFYCALKEAGFSEDERVRTVGACLRTAQANGWIVRTSAAVKSRRNHSNLQNVWRSNIFGRDHKGRELNGEEIDTAHERWARWGLVCPEFGLINAGRYKRID